MQSATAPSQSPHTTLHPVPIRVDALLPFPGYRPLVVNSSRLGRRPELFPTLEHYYQAERFRGGDASVRARVLCAPSAHEARKIALTHKDQERQDWLHVHEAIMLSGIWMMLREHPRHARQLLRADLETSVAYPFRDMYWGNDRPGASKDRFRVLLGAIRSRLTRPTTRVLVCGSRSFSNAFLLSTKLNALLAKTRPDVMLIGGDSGTDDLAEQWAITHQVPVRHILYRGKRTTSECARHHRSLVAAATHVIVFDQGDSNSGMFADLARLAGRPLRVISIAVDGALKRNGRPSSPR